MVITDIFGLDVSIGMMDSRNGNKFFGFPFSEQVSIDSISNHCDTTKGYGDDVDGLVIRYLSGSESYNQRCAKGVWNDLARALVDEILVPLGAIFNNRWCFQQIQSRRDLATDAERK